jgi:hypothetical protein
MTLEITCPQRPTDSHLPSQASGACTSLAGGYSQIAGPFETPELAWTTLKLTA